MTFNVHDIQCAPQVIRTPAGKRRLDEAVSLVAHRFGRLPDARQLDEQQGVVRRVPDLEDLLEAVARYPQNLNSEDMEAEGPEIPINPDPFTRELGFESSLRGSL